MEGPPEFTERKKMNYLNPFIGLVVILGVCAVGAFAFDVVARPNRKARSRDEHEDHST